MIAPIAFTVLRWLGGKIFDYLKTALPQNKEILDRLANPFRRLSNWFDIITKRLFMAGNSIRKLVGGFVRVVASTGKIAAVASKAAANRGGAAAVKAATKATSNAFSGRAVGVMAKRLARKALPSGMAKLVTGGIKTLTSQALKRIPIVGSLISLGIAFKRFGDGDIAGGASALFSGGLGLLDLVVPGLGFALSLMYDLFIDTNLESKSDIEKTKNADGTTNLLKAMKRGLARFALNLINIFPEEWGWGKAVAEAFGIEDEYKAKPINTEIIAKTPPKLSSPKTQEHDLIGEMGDQFNKAYPNISGLSKELTENMSRIIGGLMGNAVQNIGSMINGQSKASSTVVPIGSMNTYDPIRIHKENL
jgi:hypothetical protein